MLLKGILKLLIFVSCFTFCFLNVSAQWIQTNGFEGGSMSYYAVSGNNIMGISDQNYFYFSSDNGTSWKDVTNNLPRLAFHSIVSIGEVFVACAVGGIYRTTNNGNLWFSANIGLSSLDVNQLASNNNDLILASVSNNIYTSTDSGLSWQLININFPYPVEALTISGDKIFAGSYHGLYYLNNIDSIWINCGIGNVEVNRLSSFDNTIVACLNATLLSSTNGGLNWSPILSPGYSIISITNNNSVILACANNITYRSTNNGFTWSTSSNDFACLNYTNSRLIGGNGNGIYVSTNNGINWNSSNTGFHHLKISAIYNWNDTLYAYSDALYKSGDNGLSWFETGNINNKGIITFKSLGNYLFAGTNGQYVYRSEDRGNSWILSSSGLNASNNYINCFETSGDTLYAGTRGSICKSTNYGLSWFLPSGFYRSTNCLLKRNSFLIAGTINGIYISTNNGSTWNISNNGLNNSEITSIAAINDKIYAGSYSSGVFLSTNEGSSWAQTNGLPNEHIYSLICDNNFILAGSSSGIYVSSNQGQHWAGKNEGFHFQNNNLNTSIISMVKTNNYLFAGTVENSLWKRFYNEVTDVSTIPVQVINNYSLLQNYPNPFNPSTNIKFSLPKNSFVNLQVFDVTGKQVEELVNENLQSGSYSYNFDGTGLTSGVYFYKLSAGNFSEVKKMVLLK
ncbi:hypothetical protein BH10BAC5_BH10BAC5_01140 [soil metagenome]